MTKTLFGESPTAIIDGECKLINSYAATPEPRGNVIVLGSVNVDNFIYVDAFPLAGESILATGRHTGLGGKGANQAVAARLLGASVSFIGRIGHDDSATVIRQHFQRFGVNDRFLEASKGEETGSAHIMVNESGENTICIVPGANMSIGQREVESSVEQIWNLNPTKLNVGLAQGETSAEVTEFFARSCIAHDMRFVFNLAPFVKVDVAALRSADPLIVNESEAVSVLDTYVGRQFDMSSIESAIEAAELITQELSTSVVITLGARGAVVANSGRAWHEPVPEPRTVVDATGAGDAFVGAVVALLADGKPLHEAVQWGVAAGTSSVERRGTADSYPTLEALRERMFSGTAVA